MMQPAADAHEIGISATATDGGGPAPGVLNKDEIDSLLGFGDAADGGAHGGDEGAGIHALLNSAHVCHERLPMMDVVFDRLVRLMTASLRRFTSETVEVSLDSVQSVRFGDHLNAIPLPALLAVADAEAWNGAILLSVDSALVYSVVDILLGGQRGTAAMRIEGRPYTTIERTLVERMVQVVLDDLGEAFAPLTAVAFRVNRIEGNPRFVGIARSAGIVVLVRLRIDMDDRGGALDVLIPTATLEPVRPLLSQMVMGEKFGRDAIWERHLVDTLRATDVELTAVLDAAAMPLAEVMELKVGSRLLFDATPDDDIQMRCAGVPMYTAKMGQRGGHRAVQIEDRVHDRKRGS